MTDTTLVGPGVVAKLIVAEGDGLTLVINSGPSVVFIGGNNSIQATDASGVVPITPNSYFGVTGDRDLYACVAAGTTASLSIISGGLNFFLPLTSLTIPYGSTGERIVINPPAFPGSIVGFNAANAVEFIISANGYLLYDATGGAFQHLFLAIQNAAGTDTFSNPFAKGIQVGPQTGPQVLIGGGNPALVSFPLNDAAFSSAPALRGQIIGVGNPNRWGAVIMSGAQIPNAAHDDYVQIGLNSPSADGSSFGNGELVWIDANSPQVAHSWSFWDGNGFAIRVCSQITAADPSITASPTVIAQAESWRDLRPLSNSFVGTIAGSIPPQYRKCADGDVQIIGVIQSPPTTGNYNGVTWGTLLPAYRPNKLIRCFAGDVADGAATPVLSINPTGALTFNNMPASLATTNIKVNVRFPLDNTGMIQS